MLAPPRHNATVLMSGLARRRGVNVRSLCFVAGQTTTPIRPAWQIHPTLGAANALAASKFGGYGLSNNRTWLVSASMKAYSKLSGPQATGIPARWQQRQSWLQRRRLSSQTPKVNEEKKKTSDDPSSASPSPTTTTMIVPPKLTKILPRITTHENIYTIPNILTFTRLVAAPAVGYFILTDQPLAAVSLFFYAGVTDLIDGYLARRFNSTTVVGTVIDPMADKALMTIAVVCLALNHTLPLWLAVIILGRDVGLAISAIYFRWISLPPPKTMARYWDFSLPSAEVHPTEISKINTFLQLLLIGNAMVLPVLPESLVAAYNLTGIFEGWMYLVATTTVWSGLSYIGNKSAVKILSNAEIDEKMAQTNKDK
ncbi:uncharacterized protein PV06_03227 [Exophiala oligosperma]|uniref:CDP-diacylglycerol-glycerol-3-phosphate 3-phosphatidyltransferase n=1 Tax=Exophiala oligosperma TaxID=215243 RepID=A0A0D2E9X2_9EURO|nr:uncharacterized protein PV06_03227 [Exophiala oligosperma]KIW44779.1 hypothetical protein PV06_03227 [Exophiala oligosperma]